MFQLQDLYIEELSTQSLSGTYTIRPVLGTYYALDANAIVGVSTASGLVVRDIKTTYMTDQPTIAYLIFEIDYNTNVTTLNATARYKYNSSTNDFEIDNSWSPNHWVKINSGNLELTTNESDATNLLLADASELIDVLIVAGSAFNPASIDWKTNSFASWPTNPSTGQLETEGVELSQHYDQVIQQTDTYYHSQFGHSESANIAATDFLDNIEN